MAAPDPAEFVNFLSDLFLSGSPLSLQGEWPPMALDSTLALVVVMAIEEKYGKKLGIDEILATKGPADLLALIA